MRFTGICDPEQLAVLSNALDDHCAKYGIEPFSPDHEDASYLVMSLFMQGAQAPEELKAALDAELAGDERRQA
jgi:hypothetical protein